MFEPYAVKVARTVLRGGKLERAYLSQLDTLVVLGENYECHRLVNYSVKFTSNLKIWLAKLAYK